jgi:hypothetical protein
LLFLRHVESLEVNVDGEDDIVLGRKIILKTENWVRIVSLVSDDGGSSKQRWLVTERACQLTGTTGKSVSVRVEIAFALASSDTDSEITVENHDGATLAVFFPTDKPTHTGFILQGPYRTTPARDNILVNDPINEHLVRETCELVVETLYWLRNQGCLTTEVFHTLPLIRADFPEGSLLHPLFEHVLDALTEQPLLPAHADAPDDSKFICGNQAVAASDPELRELLTTDELKEALGGDTDWRWLAEDMSLDGDGALPSIYAMKSRFRSSPLRTSWRGWKQRMRTGGRISMNHAFFPPIATSIHSLRNTNGCASCPWFAWRAGSTFHLTSRPCSFRQTTPMRGRSLSRSYHNCRLFDPHFWLMM